MTANDKAFRRMVGAHIGLVVLWLALAAAISFVALHLAVATARSADLMLQDAAGRAERIADSMGSRGSSSAEIVSAVTAMSKEHELEVAVQAFPPERPDRPPGDARERHSSFGFVVPDPGEMLGPSLLAPPTAMVHVPGAMILLSLTNNPLGTIVRDYALAMALLACVAIVATWYVQDRTLRRALAPVTTVEGALRRLAGGEYSRLAMVGHAEGEAGVVDAYNAAADELAASIRRRAEAEANLRQFVAEAGHELRTPLTVIMGFVDVLRQGAIAEQALAQRILESVAAEGERMRSLITNLLLLARLDAITYDRSETVNLSALVAEAVDAFRALAGRADISVSAQPDVLVTGSSSEMREVVSNLLDNALKYAPEAAVRASVERDGKFAVITVQDNGPGMSAALRARAFDRFSRGDERGSVPGSGLGLAIVKRIATRAGGDVNLDSTPGQGTRVRVLLPLASA